MDNGQNWLKLAQFYICRIDTDIWNNYLLISQNKIVQRKERGESAKIIFELQ